MPGECQLRDASQISNKSPAKSARFHCVGQGLFGAALAPKSFTHPLLEDTTFLHWKLSDYIDGNVDGLQVDCTLGVNNTLQVRIAHDVELWNTRHTMTYVKLDEYIRVSKTGRLEWMFPMAENGSGAATAMSKTPSNGFEMAVDMAKDQLMANLVPEAQDLSKEWMQDTYVDNGVLIRHGT